MSWTPVALPAPAPNQAYLDVSALDGGRLACPAWMILSGVPMTSSERLEVPSLGFLLSHSASGKKVVYALGMPRLEDLSTLPGFETFAHIYLGDEGKVSPLRLFTFESDGCVHDSLKKGGVQPEEVDVVVISHLHWDHVGDARPFTEAEFILGSGAKGITNGEDPQTQSPVVIHVSAPAKRTRFIENWETSIGGLKAHDFFGDGSVHVLDTTGHLGGHIAFLARTSLDGSWILLVGDTVHHMSILHGECDFACHDNGHGGVLCMHRDPEMARDTIRKLKALVDMPRAQLQIANVNADEGFYLPVKFAPVT
ncbi:hypothetical protein CONPUDRAFT_57904 [Coniophora puteana RWD-64-598 SS2]|uniref:Metallo-beta-lactamase domain-containing protein n=1 Tax=Coniophora puteana (strain RWD-64-598) TaxID=741705 RepID=A0A5M3MMB8_CONPW|nr:uncharacterized protein CONPUDRAFT_57904 [Coniophora puteana RWD-64-598 SS2]EIW80177.1 hypothetical protein CONPUDRAFT_57904 [Coniophora puteana RWD-64-598 SS2]